MSKSVEQMGLEEPFFPTSAAMIQRWLPWVRLLRGFRIAIDARRMLIALLAVWLWGAGEWVLSYQSFSPYPDSYNGPRTDWPGWTPFFFFDDLFPSGHDVAPLPMSLKLQQNLDWELPWQLTAPMTRVLEPVWDLLFRAKSPFSNAPRNRLYLIMLLLLGATISAIFGGAISRMAAVDFARGEETSIRSAIRYSLRHWAACLGAPLIACVGFAGCWLFNFFAGLVASVPTIGESIVAILWCLPLLAGFVMALIVLGIGLGWPLMIAAVATESGDAFDSLSRAYSYLLNRPWYTLFLAICMLIYGTALLIFVEGMVQLTTHLTATSFESGYYGDENSTWRPRAERSFVPLEKLTGGMSANADFSRVVGGARTFWMTIVASIPTAFIFSYFWTMVTIIYFLLRKREDATPLGEVWMPATPGKPRLPVVGIPAAELREKQQRESSHVSSEGPQQEEGQ